MEVSRLRPWEDNPRLNDGAVDAVARSIESFGFNVPILCDQSGVIIAGHTRWKAAQKMGLNTIPVIVLEITETQRRAFAIADNKTTEIADWDFPKLQEILKELGKEEVDLPSLGYSRAELEALLIPQEDFDWAAFDLKTDRATEARIVLFPVKISFEMKQALGEAVAQYAKEHGLRGKNVPIVAGKVFAHLLGFSS